jgi:hypothetical protein
MKPIVIIAITVALVIGIGMYISTNTLPVLEENHGLYQTYIGLVNSCIEKSDIIQCENQKQELFANAKLKVGDSEKELSDFPDVFAYTKEYSSIEEKIEPAQDANKLARENIIQSFIEYRGNFESYPPSVGFSNTVCTRGLLNNVEMSGSFTNGDVKHQSIWLTLLVSDFNGNVVATGSTEIKDIGKYDTKQFIATTTWDAPFSGCIIEINDPQVESELIKISKEEENNPYDICRYNRIGVGYVEMNVITDCQSNPRNTTIDWGKFMRYSLDCEKGSEYYVERITKESEYREWFERNYFYLSTENLSELIDSTYVENGFCSEYNPP